MYSVLIKGGRCCYGGGSANIESWAVRPSAAVAVAVHCPLPTDVTFCCRDTVAGDIVTTFEHDDAGISANRTSASASYAVIVACSPIIGRLSEYGADATDVTPVLVVARNVSGMSAPGCGIPPQPASNKAAKPTRALLRPAITLFIIAKLLSNPTTHRQRRFLKSTVCSDPRSTPLSRRCRRWRMRR
jgi:hypothetical protein